jgi:hypothetical protein
MIRQGIIAATLLAFFGLPFPLLADTNELTRQEAQSLINNPEPSKPTNPAAPAGYMWVYYWHDLGDGKEKQMYQVLLPTGALARTTISDASKARAKRYITHYWLEYVGDIIGTYPALAGINKETSDFGLKVALSDIDWMVSIPDDDFKRFKKSPKTAGVTIEYTDPPYSYIRDSFVTDSGKNPDGLVEIIAHEAFHAADVAMGVPESTEHAIIYPFLAGHPLVN